MVAVQGIRPFFTTNIIYLKTLMILSIACAYTPQMCTKMCAQCVRNVYLNLVSKYNVFFQKSIAKLEAMVLD